jgi:hypothetical protein
MAYLSTACASEDRSPNMITVLYENIHRLFTFERPKEDDHHDDDNSEEDDDDINENNDGDSLEADDDDSLADDDADAYDSDEDSDTDDDSEDDELVERMDGENKKDYYLSKNKNASFRSFFKDLKKQNRTIHDSLVAVKNQRRGNHGNTTAGFDRMIVSNELIDKNDVEMTMMETMDVFWILHRGHKKGYNGRL